MAPIDSSHPEAVCSHPKAQKWLPSNFFDLWLSIDTKNSTLWAIVLAKLAVERPWWKMKIFMQKYVKIKIFLIHESCIHQKKAYNMYNTNSKRKSMIFCKKKIFLKFLIFFQRGDPLMLKSSKKNFFHFSKILKTKPKNDFHWTIQT